MILDLQTATIDRHASIPDALTTSVSHGRRKPCPSIYAHALSTSGGRADRAVFVGDSFVHDYAGPRAAGLEALLIDPDTVADVPDEHRLRSILDLDDWLAKPKWVWELVLSNHPKVAPK